MNGDTALILPFEAARESDGPRIGGKCASLARMIAGGVRVPGGFAVTTDAYAMHLRSNGLNAVIADRLSRIDVDCVDDEAILSGEIRAAVTAQAMPATVERAIRAAYRQMSPDGEMPVAVRSSATAEDLPDASFAGQQDTWLWVVGEDDVVETGQGVLGQPVQRPCHLLSRQKSSRPVDVEMAVGVQKMVNASAAGVAMTLDPITGDRTRIVIDSAFGLGEPLVSGEITPDHFVVEKVLMQILKRRIAAKDFELVADRAARRTVQRAIAPERRIMPSLSDAQVMAVARIGKVAGAQHGRPAGRGMGDRCRPARGRKSRRAAEPAGNGLEPEEACSRQQEL